MSKQDYHDAVVEAAQEAIKSGSKLLTANAGQTIEKPQGSSNRRTQTLADLLREAERRGLVNR